MHSADVFFNVLHFHTATLWVLREEGAVVGIWFLSVAGPQNFLANHKLSGSILLMVQKSGDHQLRLVVSPIIYKLLAPSQVVIAGILNHQHYQTSGGLFKYAGGRNVAS